MLSILYIGVFLSIANAQSFYLGQRWPVYSETSTSASGPSGGTITRYSTRFYDELVKNTNANIVFKKEEGTDADQYMTPRCSERANTLATLVSQEWSGKRLRVTEAWDEDGEHSTNSLHYSGRALDITTSDIDQSKYGRLAQLAADASFDWVYYEASNHVHVSCKAASCSSYQFQCSNGQCIPDYWYCDGFNDCDDYSDEPNSCSCTSNQFQCDNGDCIPSYWECDDYYDCSDHSDEGSQCSSTTTSAPTSSSPGSCFPPTALAKTEDGPVPIKDLKLGSSVLALSSSGALVYSPVIAMLDAKDDEVVNYTIIRTVDHHQIVLTPAHLIYKTDYNDKISGSEVTVPDSPLFASHVKKGDIIFAATAGDETVKPERVASAVVKQMRGAYAPLTKEGNMIIDNVLVSCYAVVNDHNLAHNSFAPLRYLYDLLPGAIIGGSSKDIHWYPQLLMKIAEIFLDETSYYPMEIKEILNTTMY